VIIKVYADESGTHDETGQTKGSEVPVVAGYFAPADYWVKFCDEWQSVLAKYKAPYFHNKELGKHRRLNSPYFGWDKDRVTDFRYDLAMIAGSEAIPIGGLYHAKKHHQLGFKGKPFELAFQLFFNDFCEAMNSHKLGFAEKILFIFDNNDNKKWKKSLNKVYGMFKEKNPTFGDLTFEDDQDSLHLGLQAADLYASASRQLGVPHMESGKQLQPMRILDLILNQNLREKNHPWNYSQMHPLMFKLVTDLFRADEKRQKKEWAVRGLQNKEYYPFEHFPFEKFGIKK
jgi:hypothetical protein